jgi:acetyl-CoA carboxylase biotin carboxyl carrier protein
MSAGKSDGGQTELDLAEVRRLVKLMKSNDLAEVEIELEGKRVRVVRAGHGAPLITTGFAPQLLGPAPGVAAAAAPVADAAPAKLGTEIPCPMVGTFYRAPSPDAAPFAEVGDRIGKETVVCIIEAMKVMNEIKAEVEGEILEILVQNGEPVEFGQPLFLVRPSGSGAA